MSSVNIIKSYIEDLLQVIRQYTPLINSHMVDYFVKNHYENCIPSSIRVEIENLGYENTIQRIFLNNVSNDTPHLYNYIKTTKDYSLYNRREVCLSLGNLQEQLTDAGCHNISGLQLKVFMKPKKSHEVEILSAVIASLKTIDNISHIVDIGDGKGYLSSLLSLHYKIPVLGIDASAVNTTGAVKRAEKLGKLWPGIVKTNKSMLPKSEQKYTSNLLYKQVTQFVTEETDFKELVSNVFMEKISGLSLVGLHTCGNLSPAALKIFCNNTEVKTLCIVGCCYHLLSEKDTSSNTKDQYGFPMSEFLISQDFSVGRKGRMLSAQSTDRILCKMEMPNKNIFYRAVLEVILNKHRPEQDTKHIGKIKISENITFVEYVQKALTKLNLVLDIDEHEINKIYNMYLSREKELYAFNLLRCMISPVIESLILLDRLLYLQECGFENSYVVQLFDPVISPRCYGIISYKKT